MINRACVLTGDVVRSTLADEQALIHTFETLRAAANEVEHWWERSASTRFTRYRGDGWHLVIPDPKLAFRAAIYVHAKLRATKRGLTSRISIGIGGVASMGTENLSDASGGAFIISGQGLDKMKRGQLMTIDGDGVTPLHRAIILLAAERTSRWSKEQAEAVALDMIHNNPTLADIAALLGITTQAVSARLGGAGYQALREALQIWESKDNTLWQPGDTA
jgi:hypothetical protein